MACKRRSTDVVWLLEKSPTSSFRESSSVEGRASPGVFCSHHKTQKGGSFCCQQLLPLRRFWEVWRRANIPIFGCVVGVKKKILKLYEEYGALGEIQVRERQSGRNEEMHLQRQPRRHVQISRIPRQRSEDPRGRQGVLGGSEGGLAELLDGWRGREGEASDEEKRRKRQRWRR
ncbi:hypothetical protein GWK47_036685 [Chionoecetes opilio]|uniref:Uncharacterized protein n=1 Tax=Chionoecetes opilio TaxID=41210 RepID=A0A8J4YT26_CHIOP|nr:hypothetical protein GWK47_036685 [Chionoecetes opilio]